MRFRVGECEIKKSSCILLCCLLTVISLNLSTFSQTIEGKKPKIKNFGSSLKRPLEENLRFSNNKVTNNYDGDEETIRIETRLVVLDFLVLTSKGNAVLGLKQEDFILTEDDHQQEIQTFTTGDNADLPRTIVLIIDYSSSQSLYLNRSVEAAKLLVDKLRPNDLMAIVTDDVKIISNYTNDKKKLKGTLESLKPDDALFDDFGRAKEFGKSKQYSSLYAVLNEMFSAEDVRPIVIFQTDGDEVFFLKGQFGHLIYKGLSSTQRQTNFSFDDLLTMSDKSRATVYTVFSGIKLLGLSPEEKKLKIEEERRKRITALGLDPNKPLSVPPRYAELLREAEIKIKQYYPNGPPDTQKALAGLSGYTGGWIDFLETPEQADGIYSSILDQITDRYVVGFSPTNETRDGKRRVVKISVKNHPEYTVWGRKTYLAPLPE